MVITIWMRKAAWHGRCAGGESCGHSGPNLTHALSCGVVMTSALQPLSRCALKSGTHRRRLRSRPHTSGCAVWCVIALAAVLLMHTGLCGAHLLYYSIIVCQSACIHRTLWSRSSLYARLCVFTGPCGAIPQGAALFPLRPALHRAATGAQACVLSRRTVRSFGSDVCVHAFALLCATAATRRKRRRIRRRDRCTNVFSRSGLRCC